MNDIEAAVSLAERLAGAARPIAVRYFRSRLAVDDKPDASPVTAADREIEARLREMITAAYPEHGIVGEEHGVSRSDAAFVWVIDPIDGTKSFVTGKPLFGTLIALLRDGVPIVGVIEMSALSERWVGATGRRTTFNGEPVASRPCSSLASAWLYTTSPYMFRGGDEDGFERLQSKCKAAIFGADCYAYGLVASGFVDLVCEASTKPYDYCALVPVVEGAGGAITDWNGAPLGLGSDGRILAAGDPARHEDALQILAE